MGSMRHIRCPMLFVLATILSAGCGRVVFRPSPTAQVMTPQQQQQIAQQGQQLQQRASELDRSNQELESLLAQSRQQNQVLNDQLSAVRGQLETTNQQLADFRVKNETLRQQSEALTASVRTNVGAEIRANNSLVKELAIARMPGVEVRSDGDVVRVEVTSDLMFQGNTAYFSRGASSILRSVAGELLRNYPEQRIGIEAHTDGLLVKSSDYPSNHHLTVAQGTAVYEFLANQARVPPEQIFVVAHGANYPVVSNATEAGRKRNRRIEFVIYPEKIPR